MDKSWSKMMNRINRRYVDEAKEFSEMAKLYADNKGEHHIRAPSV